MLHQFDFSRSCNRTYQQWFVKHGSFKEFLPLSNSSVCWQYKYMLCAGNATLLDAEVLCAARYI